MSNNAKPQNMICSLQNWNNMVAFAKSHQKLQMLS